MTRSTSQDCSTTVSRYFPLKAVDSQWPTRSLAQAQDVGHAIAAVRVQRPTRQPRDGLAQVPVLKAFGQHPEGEQRREQGLNPRVAEAQRRGGLGVDDARPMEVVEPLCSDGAVMADALHAQKASVGGEGDFLQIIEIFQPSADTEVLTCL